MHSLSILLAAVVVGATPSQAQVRFCLDSLPTTTDPDDRFCELMLRELPRQALLIAASADRNIVCIDLSLEPGATRLNSDKRLALTRKLEWTKGLLQIRLMGDDREVVESVALPFSVAPSGYVDYGALAPKIEEVVEKNWRQPLEQRLSASFRSLKFDSALASLESSDSRLATVDLLGGFLVARQTHALIAQSGESARRLGTLIRAYAHLGEATRHLLGGQSTAFFARSLLYAERLARLAPNSASTYWHRAYAYALLGLPSSAGADLKRGDELAKERPESRPAWVELTREFLDFRTTDLSRHVNGPDAPLAAYFAWLTVEHGPLPSETVTAARSALRKNPGALRILDAITANTGVGIKHQTTLQSFDQLNELLATLATDPLTTAGLREATARAVRAEFEPSAVLDWLNTLEARSRERGQLLPWSVLASVVRECEFISVFRRLDFLQHAWSVDPSGELQALWPLVKAHRYAPIVASLDRSGRLKSGDLPSVVRTLKFTDDQLPGEMLVRDFRARGVPKHPGRNISWIEWHDMQSDHTAYDLAQMLWLYRDGDDSYAKARRQYAQALARLAPDHPLAIAVRLCDDWTAMAPEISRLQRDFAGKPAIAYALGCALARTNQLDQAAALLEAAAKLVPDRKIYTQLAEIALRRNDEGDWLKVWERYLDASEDLGLDHASVCEQIARRFLKRMKPADALPFAKRSADSYSAWGLSVYADTLLALRQYDDAIKILLAEAERYGYWGQPYWLARATGRGDAAATAKIYGPIAKKAASGGYGPAVLDYGLFLYLEGRPEEAGQAWRRAPAENEPKNSLTAALAALVMVEAHRTAEAIAYAASYLNLPANTPRDRAYQACITEMHRCLSAGMTVPSREGAIGKILNDPALSIQRGNVCYVLGRVAELGGHFNEAKTWYRASLDTPERSFTCRPMSALALRKLGQEYYP